MSTKSHWEERVGMLLDPQKHPSFVWSYKPPDSQMYGGQPRVDWLACDLIGRLWMIEVKLLEARRKSLNLLTDVTPGQRAALDGVASSWYGMPLLAIGHEKTLYLFSWKDIAWLLTPESPSPLLRLDSPLLHFEWSGPKRWLHPLFSLINDRLPDMVPRSEMHFGPLSRQAELP